MPPTRRDLLTGTLGAAGLAALGGSLTGCDRQTPQDAPSRAPSSLVFANAAEPPTLDPSVTTNLETSRVSAQVLETLTRAHPDTGQEQPGLAESWTVSDDGLEYSFVLRDGVRFHDGTVLTADVVRRNVERWQKNTRTEQTHSTAFQNTFRAYDPRTQEHASILRDCRATDERTVLLRLTRRYTPLLRALTQPAFGIGSPRAFANEDAYLRHPVGTGPFEFSSWKDRRIQLQRFPDYWGTAAHLERLDFVAVAGAQSRYYQLLTGRADAYDQVGISDFANLARRGDQIQQRDPYNIAYVTMNQDVPVLRSAKVRQAVAHAINRAQIVRDFYPQGTKVANDFTPDLFDVDAKEASRAYEYDTNAASDLLKAAEYDGQPLRFYYPTDITLPYLQQPEAIFADIASGLTKAGFVVKPVPIKWSEDYLDRISRPDPDRALALGGMMGTFRDPDDFLAPLFGYRNDQLSTRQNSLFAAVAEAAASTDQDDRNDRYRTINQRLADLVLAVPLAHPISAVALSPRVSQYPLAATGVANFAKVQTSG